MVQVTCRHAKYLPLILLTEIMLLFYYLYKLTSGGVHRTKLRSENTEGIDCVNGMGVQVTAILTHSLP